MVQGLQQDPIFLYRFLWILKLHQKGVLRSISSGIQTNTIKIIIMRVKYNTFKRLTISGKEVSCSTLITETPAFSKEVAVPPVETMVYLENYNMSISNKEAFSS